MISVGWGAFTPFGRKFHMKRSLYLCDCRDSIFINHSILHSVHLKYCLCFFSFFFFVSFPLPELFVHSFIRLNNLPILALKLKIHLSLAFIIFIFPVHLCIKIWVLLSLSLFLLTVYALKHTINLFTSFFHTDQTKWVP